MNPIFIKTDFLPDIVQWTAIKFGTCVLCRKEYDSGNFEHDNSGCPHCKKLSKYCSGVFTAPKESAK